MPRSRLCRVCKDFHSFDEPWPSACAEHFGPQAHGGAAYVISDTMPAIRSMASGQMFDSKSRYRSDLKARGMVEVGNERVEQRPAPTRPIRGDLRDAYNSLRGL